MKKKLTKVVSGVILSIRVVKELKLAKDEPQPCTDILLRWRKLLSSPKEHACTTLLY